MSIQLISNRIFGLSQPSVGIYSDSLDFPVQRNIFGFRRDISLIFDRVWIEVDRNSIPDYIDVDVESLFNIKFVGRKDFNAASSISNLKIDNYTNPYVINYHPMAVRDCNNLNVEEFEVKFQLKFRHNNNGDIKSENFSLKINLTKATPKLNVFFDFAEGERKLPFRNSVVLIGSLQVRSECPYRYANRSSVQAIVKFDRAFQGDIVSPGSKIEITESNPYYEANAGLIRKEDMVPSCLVSEVDEQNITLKNLVANNTVSIPLYFDMMRIGNPSIDELPLKFSVDITNLVDGKNNIHGVEFSVIRDKQRTQMNVLFNGVKIDNEQTVNAGTFKWVERIGSDSKRFRGKTKIISLAIANIAENEGDVRDSAVWLRNICAEVVCNSDEVSKAITTVAKFENQEIRLPNAPFSNISLDYYLNHIYINKIPNDAEKVTLRLNFDYFEDLYGDGADAGEYSHFSTDIDFVIETDPGNEWLCIDFGTSATVASFGDGAEEAALLNLDKIAEEMAQTLPQRLRIPRFEEGTKFLSSNCKLRLNGEFSEDKDVEYKRNFVQLAPTEPQFYSDSYMLPYVKSLIGYDTLPSVLKYGDLLYTKDGQKLKFGESPLSVDEIFRAVYKSLLKDFVIPAIAESEHKVNKVILSVPNTYTPRHMDYLRHTLKLHIPEVRDNYIWFISESDAIASYYITNWHELNKNRDEVHFNELTEVGAEEYVVAFDMGAGTLDVTYFAIRTGDNDIRQIEMLAKIGLNKAGNYLDYVIAEALIDSHPHIFPKALLSPGDDAIMLTNAGKLKHFIRETLKPNMFETDSMIFSDLKGETFVVNGMDKTLQDEEIDVKTIRNHKLLRDFVKECTEDLLENLFALGNCTKGDTPIDTIIFTGRSVQFGNGHPEGIRTSLMKAIAEWDNDSEREEIELQGDRLKTVVCEGALSFATIYNIPGAAVKFNNRNIYASYGVVYKDVKGVMQYKELLTPATKPVVEPNTDTNSSNGLFIYQYDTDYANASGKRNGENLDLRGCSRVYFVQSYSSDTAKDFHDGRFEMISIMWDPTVKSAVSNVKQLENVHVRIEVNADNEMVFTLGELINEPSASMKIDIKKSDSFKKSMWPYL